MNKYLGIFFALSALAFASYISRQSIEESSIFRDEVVNNAFIRRLEEEDIQFRVGENRMVFYQIRYRGRVKEIHDEIMEEFHPGRAVQIHDAAREKLFLDNLSLYGIEYRIIRLSDGKRITWNEEDDAKAHQIFEEGLSVDR